MPTPTSYIYSLPMVNIDQITANIENSGIATAIDHLEAVGFSPTNVKVLFRDSLSPADLSTLSNVFSSYVYVAPAMLVQKVEVTAQPSVTILSQPDPAPFAQPTYRTKRDATLAIVNVSVGQTVPIDYQLTSTLYAQGGQLLVVNGVLGDYISAEIYDKDGIIPAPYRAVMCEAWPSAAKYIIKEWINPTGEHTIDTYPLNAKITAGLYLRITYTACSTGTDRQVGVNYFLTKKL